jgi:O-acetyl-ADP-ribose deacetylase (regulator of RNase III)
MGTTMTNFDESKPVFEVVLGDITKFAADVIVNSAHESLAPGGGVSGAIHKAAGPGLAAECAEIAESRGWLAAGEVAITKSYNLPAKFAVHAIAPRYADLGPSCHVQLSMAYRRAIAEAGKVSAKSIVFPSLGAGIFGFPIESAPAYALDGIRTGVSSNLSIERVTICCFSEPDLWVYLSQTK